MKKLVVIIIVLLIIFSGMIIYKNIAIKSNNSVSVQDVEKIETYITKIYMWREVTDDALPVFNDINEASDTWIWEVVKKNLENYELSYDEIQNKAVELFGAGFTKTFPKEGTSNFIYDEETDKYYATGMGLDQEEDCFLLNNIEETNDGYVVEIVEYLEDYSAMAESGENYIIIRNLNDEEIGKIQENQEQESTDIVKSNIDKFSKKHITLKKEGSLSHCHFAH